MNLSYCNESYTSKEELCKRYSIDPMEFARLEEQGLNLHEIMLKLAPTNPKLLVYDGLVYFSYKHFCNMLDIDYYRFRRVYNKTADITAAVNYAKAEPGKYSSEMEVDGVIYKNLYHLAMEKGISYPKLLRQVNRQKMTPAEAVRECLQSQENTNFSHPVEYEGKLYPSCAALCKEMGWPVSRFYYFLKTYSLEKAVAVCKKQFSGKLGSLGTVVYNGKEYSSVFALAKKMNVGYNSLRDLIFEKQMNPDDAVALMLKRKRKKPLPQEFKGASKKVTVRGIEFPSIKAALTHFQLHPTTYYKLKDKRDLPASEIIEEILQSRQDSGYLPPEEKEIKVFGVVHSSLRLACIANRTTMRAVSIRKKKYHCSDKEALEGIVNDRRNKEEQSREANQIRQEIQACKDPVTICGITYPDGESLVGSFSFSVPAIMTWQKQNNCSVKDAIIAMAQAKKIPNTRSAFYNVPVIVGGHSFANVQEAMKYYNVTKSRLDHSIYAEDITIEDAILAIAATANARKVSINGKVYLSVYRALSGLGLSLSNFYYFKKKNPEFSDVELIQQMLDAKNKAVKE